jgi:DNA-binding NarL/FixJ family response regulator
MIPPRQLHSTDGYNPYVSPLIARDVVKSARESDRDPTVRDLSSREREVLQLLAEGRSMKEVAGVMGISPRTVEFHKYRIMGVLGVKTNAELVQYAVRLGLI